MNVTDWLKEREDINNAATEGVWETSQAEDEESTTFIETPYRDVLVHDERGHGYMREEYTWMRRVDATAIVDAHNNSPKAYAALEKVLDLHERVPSPLPGTYDRCADDGDTWPCDTYRTITEALGLGDP